MSGQAGGTEEKQGVVPRVMGFLTRRKRLVQAGVLALIAIFVGTAVWRSWSQLSHYRWQVQWGLLLAAFALLAAQELSYAFIWRGILARMGARLDVVSSQRIYLGAEFVRYIPGNVWHVITRVLWAEQRGVPKTIGFASMVVELATKISSAALVFVLTLLFWPDTHALAATIPHASLVVVGAVLVPLLLFGLQPRLLRGTLNYGLRKAGREPVTFTLRYCDVLLVTLYWTLSWLVAGAGFYLLVRALVTTPVPASGLILAIGIYAIGWDIGFVSFVTPSGLGFREVAIAGLLLASGLAPGIALATVVALIARLLSTGSELVCIAGAHAVRGAPPLPQPEPVAPARAP